MTFHLPIVYHLNVMKKAFLFILVLLRLTALLFSQQSYSKQLEEALLQDKYSLEIDLLKGSLSKDFPYNIIIKDKNQHYYEEKSDKVCIIISQIYAVKHYEALKGLFELVNKEAGSLEILLSANDEAIHPSIPPSLQGIQTYIENKSDLTHFYAIIIRENEKNSKSSFKLDIGAKNRLSPLKLVKVFIEKFNTYKLDFSIKGSFSSFVRLQLVEDNPVLAYLLTNEIPALAIHANEEDLPELIQLISEHLNENKNLEILEESSQYNFFHIFNQFFSVSEFQLVSLILIFAFIILLIIVFFPFLLGRNRFIHKQELKKNWPLLPILVIANALFYYVSQNLIEVFFPEFHSLPQFVFLIKLIFSLFFIFLISLAQIIFKFPLSSIIYGYLGSFIALINIFIFTFIDISFFIPFSLEFLVLIITSNFRQKKGLFFTLLLMTLPFLPYLLFSDTEVINNLFRLSSQTSFFGNILLALILIPFQIVWIKILIRMKHFGKQKGLTLKKFLIDIGMNLAAMICIIAFVQFLIHKNIIVQDKIEKTNTISRVEGNYITHKTKKNFNYDTLDIELLIKSSLLLVRYEIKIHSPSILPIYEANYPYDILTEPEWAIFNLDDYPPEELTLRFSSQASLDISVFVKAYLLDDGKLVLNEEEFIIRGENESN